MDNEILEKWLPVKEWQDWETFELVNVIGWYDLTDDLK